MYTKISEAYQDMIGALDADLETGSHHFNNVAADEFALRYSRFTEAMNKLGEVIQASEQEGEE
jgi:hypothetical protein